MCQTFINENYKQTEQKQFENSDEQEIKNEYLQAFVKLFGKQQMDNFFETKYNQFLYEFQNNEFTWLFQIYHLFTLFLDQKNKNFEIYMEKTQKNNKLCNLLLGERVDQERNGQPLRSRSDDDMANYSKMVDMYSLDKLDKRFQEQQNQIQQHMKENEDLTNEINKLKQKIDNQNILIKSNEIDIRELEERSNLLNEELQNKIEEMHKLNLNLKEFQDIKEVMIKQAETLQILQKKEKLMEEQIRKSQEELLSEKRRADNLQSKIKELDQIKEYQNQISDLKIQNQIHLQNSNTYYKNMEAYKQKLEKEAKEKQFLLDQSKYQKVQMQIEIDEKQQMILKQNEIIEHNESEKLKLSQKIKNLGYILQDQQKEIESLKCQISSNSDKQTYTGLDNSPTKLDIEMLGVQGRKGSFNFIISNQGQHISKFNSNFKLNNKFQDTDSNYDSPLSSNRSNIGSSRQTENLSQQQQLDLLKDKEDTINIYKNKLKEQSETIQEQVAQIKLLNIKLKEADSQLSQNVPTNILDISREYRKLMVKFDEQEKELEQLRDEVMKHQQDKEEDEYEFDKQMIAQQQMYNNEITQKDEEIKLLISVIYELRIEHIQRQNNSKLKTFLKKLQTDPIQDSISTGISAQSSSQ